MIRQGKHKTVFFVIQTACWANKGKKNTKKALNI